MAIQSNTDELLYLASQFRAAIEKAKSAGEFESDNVFREFPYGCCGDTCDLLATYLIENDYTPYYVCGTYRGGSFEQKQSHAWLTVGNKIIDITGDQFKFDPLLYYFDKPVYSGNAGRFHKAFEVDERFEHKGIEYLDDYSQARLFGIYARIMQYIPDINAE